ncbi:hypothetical protein EDC19_0609 [Natranaerovirga hydrolytica]|uniref:Uncharacterized protein n=1 Tax=Natranaerovirga hydrolytica TaxID=680378 RepID=A0A4V6NFI4_9FIRM|nr:hypothetical protein [Natranaerovirga hydrolytica]TCK98191.1 hypothetical protein EDC19_0609 [Natranaerovirga hydrolytica]
MMKIRVTLEKYTMVWKYTVACVAILYGFMHVMILWDIINPSYFGISVVLFSVYVSMTLPIKGIIRSALYGSYIIGINIIIYIWKYICYNITQLQLISLIILGGIIGIIINNIFMRLEKGTPNN